MSKWVKRDRRYRKGYRLTSHAWRMMLGWGAFIVIWLLLGSLYGWPGLLGLLTVIAYGGFSAVRGASRRAVTRATPPVTYLPPPAAPLGQRNTRSIPQAVKIAVVTRDGGRCRQCGSADDLHFDHVIPWSKGGANTVANIQLLCGRCNRRKGADDIPIA
jgi:hypothetical protein